MGNNFKRKEANNQKKAFYIKPDSGGGISNIPGIAAPPKFENNVTFRKKNEITKNDLIKKSQRQSHIDTLPRHTAGSAKVIESIANIKESTSRNINDDDDDDEDSVSNMPIYNKSRSRSNITDTKTSSSKNALSDILDELKNKNIPQANNYDKIKKSTVPKVIQASSNNNKPIKPVNTKIDDNIPSVTDNEYSDDNIFQNERKLQLNASKRNLANSSLLINLKNQRSSSSSHFSYNGRHAVANHLQIDSSSKNLKKLNKKRQKVYSNLVSLNKIENNQKSKILEQERLLKIQNMKLQDALIIEKSLINFDDYSKHEDFDRERQIKFEKNNTTSRSSAKPSIVQKRIPIKFPSIVTRYEPRQSMESISVPRSSYYSSNYYEPRRSRSMILSNGLYLQTTQDIIDSRGRILSTNKSSRYLGESIEKTDIQSQFYKKSFSPEFEINNHKYEILSSNRKLAASELKSNELNNIINIIEKLEKNEATDYHNFSQRKVPNTNYPTFINNSDYNYLKRTNSINDLTEPSFTIPENIYKSIITKKSIKSHSFKGNYNGNINTGYFKPILRPEEAQIIKSQPKRLVIPDSSTNEKTYSSQFFAEL